MESNKKRKCYDCKHFYQAYFCGYNASNCYIYGSLDCDQKERHPDETAETCKDYDERKQREQLIEELKELIKHKKYDVFSIEEAETILNEIYK